MARTGASRQSLRQAGPWSGMSLLSRSTPGRLALLENAYVNSDGTEVRMMPGYKCVIDPETVPRATVGDTTLGYMATHVDARRAPFVSFAGNAYYLVDNASPTESMSIWNTPGILHCMEQVHGRWIIVGESDHRREPIYNLARTAFVGMTSVEDNGTDIIITFNEQPNVVGADFNTVAVGDGVLFDGVTGPLASLLNLGLHTVLAFPTATTMRVDTSSGGVVAPAAQNANVSRGKSNSRNPLGTSNDAFSDLTIWTSTAKGDQDVAPSQLVREAHVANRMPDFGDATGNRKEGNANAATPSAGTSRRRSVGLPYRLVPHVSGNRLIMAAPGYGCVFQAPVVIPPSFSVNDTADGIGALSNDIYDRPRSLGVPKAVVWEDPDKTIANTFHVTAVVSPGAGVPDFRFGGSDVSARAGTYQFMFSYADEGTGEMGLCSEPISVTTDSSTVRQGIRFCVMFPGYLLNETLATTINVYRTTKDGKTFYFDRSIPISALRADGVFATFSGQTAKYGLRPETGTTQYLFHALYQALYISDAELVKQLNPVPNVLEQMPMGCKASRTIRGFTFFGGALGDAGPRKEMFKGTTTLEFDPASGAAGIYPNHDEITLMHTNSVTAPVASGVDGAETWLMCGARRIPPAYSGQTIVGRNVSPGSRRSLDLVKSINTKVGWDVASPIGLFGRISDIRFTIRDTPVAQSESLHDSTRRAVVTYLKLPRAKLQISEPDNPNIVPATNTMTLANEIDDDIEGIGDAGGQAVVCTKAKTYMVGFSQSPIGGAPDVADERFGCIAPNSMVSFEGGCAWISDRGPVALIGGQVQWIGKSISTLFSGESAIYMRDSDGMMRHSWACHDAERSLLYFGVFSNRNAGTELEVSVPVGTAKTLFSWEALRGTALQDNLWSKFPCDEVLVYSYRVDAWSVWRPPLAIQWMTRGQDADGVDRVFFLGADRRVYVLDDNWSNGDREVSSYTAAANETITSLTTSVSHISPWKGSNISVVRTDSEGKKSVVASTTILSESRSGANTTITFGSITTKVGDLVTIGARQMRLRTTTLNFKQSDTSMNGPIVASYAMESRADVGGVGQYDAFAKAYLETTRVEGGIPVKKSLTLNADDPTNFCWLGSHAIGDPVRDQKIANGQAVGQGAIIDLTIQGNAQVRLQDIFFEVA